MPVVCIADPSIAEQFTKSTPFHPESTPKMVPLKSVGTLVGETSVATAQVSAAINADFISNLTLTFVRDGIGALYVRDSVHALQVFQPKAIYGAIPRIIDYTDVFVSRLLVAARNGVDVLLGDFLADLATDIISSTFIGYDMRAQQSVEGENEKGPQGLLTCFRQGVLVQPKVFGSGFLAQIQRLFPELFAVPQVDVYRRTLDARLTSIVQQDAKSGFAARYIGSEQLTPSLLQECLDQAKTLILAGQDTTSCALQWIFFHLWKYPEVLDRLRTEHDSILGQEPDKASTLLRAKPQLLQELPYTTAVIKETLRIRGIAGTARELDKDTIIDVDGKPVRAETGAIYYVNNYILMKNTEYWGADAETFRPERFLEDGESQRRARQIAYRPFERGPRNCIGQEFSMLEMRVALALTVRKFDFVKKGYDGISEEEVYDTTRVVHSPIDRMKMRFSERTL